MNIHVDVVSAEGEIYSGSATRVFAPALMGEVGIMPRHAPLLTGLQPGHLRIEHGDSADEHVFVSGGLLEVQPHLVTVMADTAERAAEIDQGEAEKARQRAEEAVNDAPSEVDREHARKELLRAAARVDMVKRIRDGH